MSISSEPRSPWLAGHVPRDLARPKPWLTAPDRCRDQAGLEQTVEVADRAQFEARLSRRLEKSRVTGEDFGLIVLALDELSRLNDEHGYQKGNEAILLVRAREFFEKIRAEVAERSERDLGLTVRLSAGAVKPLDYSGDTADLLGAADYAMYLAKRQGRDRLFATVVVGHDDGENGGRIEERGR